MGKKYTKVEHLASVVEFRHNQGETYREIATSMGLSREQVRELMKRERRKQRKIEAGYIPQPKGRPRKSGQSEEERKNNEIVLLRMQVELLRNFLYEAGRR